MIDQDIIKKMKDRYSHLHPLIFHRSVERSGNAGELFDILESIPEDLPVVWDENIHRWVVTDDLSQSRRFDTSPDEQE